MTTAKSVRSIAIACGGTGGHVFPGLAVAQQLVKRGCAVTLLISPKPVDQQAVKMADGMEIVTLPAVGLERGNELAFFRGFRQSYRAAKKLFRTRPPQAVLAMGSFTSAPPILAGKICGARTFLHESNTIPGRANRWLARLVNGAFVGFPCAAGRLKNRQVSVTGTPVRPSFKARDAAACRLALGLDPAQPVVVITGGSQGASGLNELVLQALPLVARLAPELQWFHLAGTHDVERVSRVYAELGLKAVVHPFFDQMELVLGAASAAISRAGASSLAELAALRVPSLLVPYPIATDNHQFHNARSFADTGAARLLEQERTTPQSLAHSLLDLVCNTGTREEMQAALARWQSPRAAEQIAETMLEAIGEAKSSAFAGPALEALGLPDTFLLNPPEAVADSQSSLAERAIV